MQAGPAHSYRSQSSLQQSMCFKTAIRRRLIPRDPFMPYRERQTSPEDDLRSKPFSAISRDGAKDASAPNSDTSVQVG